MRLGLYQHAYFHMGAYKHNVVAVICLYSWCLFSMGAHYPKFYAIHRGDLYIEKNSW